MSFPFFVRGSLTSGNSVQSNPAPSVFFSFTSAASDDGFTGSMTYTPGINCGVYPGDNNGYNSSVDSSTWTTDPNYVTAANSWYSNTGNARVEFNRTEQARFTGLPCVKFYKNTENDEACGSDQNAQRAEAHNVATNNNEFETLLGAEGNVFYVGYSFMFSALDATNECTLYQMRAKEGAGSPGTELVYRPDINPSNPSQSGIVMLAPGGTVQEGTALIGNRYLLILDRNEINQSNLNQWYDIVMAFKVTRNSDGWFKVWCAPSTPNQASPLVFGSPVAHVTDTPIIEDGLSLAVNAHERWGLYGWGGAQHTSTEIGSANWLMEMYASGKRLYFAGSGTDPGQTAFDAVIPRSA